MSPHFAMRFWRTALNGWPTSARIHSAQGVRACVFGCPGLPDDMRHYRACPGIWPVLSRALFVIPLVSSLEDVFVSVNPERPHHACRVVQLVAAGCTAYNLLRHTSLAHRRGAHAAAARRPARLPGGRPLGSGRLDLSAAMGTSHVFMAVVRVRAPCGTRQQRHPGAQSRHGVQWRADARCVLRAAAGRGTRWARLSNALSAHHAGAAPTQEAAQAAGARSGAQMSAPPLMPT